MPGSTTHEKKSQAEAIAFLAGRWPDEGGRHKAYAALAGGLLRSGLAVDRVEALVEDLAEAVNDDDVARRLGAVASTADKIKNKKPATGWPRLAKLCRGGEATVAEFRRRMGLTITLERLAAHKKLPLDFLQAEGLHDLPLGGIGIPYKDISGKTIAVKERRSLKAGKGSYWPSGKPLMAFGEHRLEDATRADYLVLVEGETDSLTLWFHGEPALGIPGAETVAKTLHLGYVANRHTIFAVEETDASGKDFVQNAADRLAALGWAGELKVVRLGVKDVSELHCRNPEGFKAAWKKVLAQAQAVEVKATAHVWPEPLPLGVVPEVPPFPVEVLPAVLRRYVLEGAAALPCPPDYVAVPLLTVAGASIGASRALEVKPGHIQRASLYTGVVASPGSGKSPAQEWTTGTVHEAEEQLHAAWEQAMEAYEVELHQWEADVKEAKKNKEDPPPKPARPILPRMAVDDFTVEGLVEVLRDNPRGVVVAVDELTGWALRMNQYRSGGDKGGDRQFFLSAWSGANYVKDRSKDKDSGPIRLRHPFLAVVGGIPPRKLRTLRGDRPGQPARDNDDGFLDRLLFSYAKEIPAVEEDWCELAPQTLGAVAEVLDRLRSLPMVAEVHGARVCYRPFVVRLTAAGRQAWREFTRLHAAEVNSPDFPDFLRGPWSKLRGYCGRLALLIHYLRWACREVEGGASDVDEEEVRRAAKLVAYFKGHARKVYRAMDADPRVTNARKLLEWIRRERRTEFKRWEAHKDLQSDTRFPTAEALDVPLDLLTAHGYIRPRDAEQRQGAGRKPSTVYEVNPLAYQGRRENRVNRENDPPDDEDGGNAWRLPDSPDLPDAPDSGSAGGRRGHSPDLPDAAEEDSQQAPTGQVDHAGCQSLDPKASGESGKSGVSPEAYRNGDGESCRPKARPSPSTAYHLVTDADGLGTVLAALGDAEEIGVDVETTGLDPRQDRVRLLQVAVPTIDGGTFTYLVDCFAVSPAPLFEALAGRTRGNRTPRAHPAGEQQRS
jgi:hypothetical protein